MDLTDSLEKKKCQGVNVCVCPHVVAPVAGLHLTCPGLQQAHIALFARLYVGSIVREACNSFCVPCVATLRCAR